MAVLQAHQADLLKDLDEGKGLSPEAMEGCTTDLDLHAAKQTAAAISQAMAQWWLQSTICG